MLRVLIADMRCQLRNGDVTEGSKSLKQTFASYDAFLASGLFSHYRSTCVVDVEKESFTWLNSLTETQQAVLQFLAGMLAGSPQTEEVLNQCLDAEYLISAEQALGKAWWKDREIFDLEQCCQAHTAYLQPATVEAAAEPSSVPAAPVAPPVPKDGSAAEQMWQPDIVPEAAPEVPEIPVDSYFPALQLTELQKDVLRRVSAEKLANVVSHAKVSAAKKITISVGAAFTADFEQLNAGLQDPRTHVYIWDVKSGGTNCSPLAHRFPYRFTPPFAKGMLTPTLHAVFGEKADSERLFRKQDFAFFLDGRVPTVHTDLLKEVKKALKNLPNQTVPTRKYTMFEFFYANREFTTGFLKPKSTRTQFHALMPGHTERAVAVMGTQFSVEHRERKWLDLPGSNRSLGWSGNQLQDPEEQILVSWATKVEMFKKVVNTSASVNDEAMNDDEMKAAAASQVEANERSLLWPWASPEVFWKELYNCLGDPANLVIMTATPSASGAIAAARMSAQYIGWVGNSSIKAVLMDSIALRISLDLLLNNRQASPLRLRNTVDLLAFLCAGLGPAVSVPGSELGRRGGH